MREIVIISGKGGTGKTSLTGAFAHLAANKVVCDLDVDAPDLHLLLQPSRERTEDFRSGYEAQIDSEKCNGCGLCASLCRFGAVREGKDGFAVDPLRCEGCKVCVAFCPVEAVRFPQKYCGQWYVSSTRFGPLVHAQLIPGAENSGRLVMVLKQQARELAKARGLICAGTFRLPLRSSSTSMTSTRTRRPGLKPFAARGAIRCSRDSLMIQSLPGP